VRQLPAQPGLADARLADEDDEAATGARLLPVSADLGQLVPTTDEGRVVGLVERRRE
jgi:hypothetical protein